MSNTSKLWCVIITNDDEPHNPQVYHTNATSQKEAKDKILEELPITEDDIIASDNLDIIAIEVEITQ